MLAPYVARFGSDPVGGRGHATHGPMFELGQCIVQAGAVPHQFNAAPESQRAELKVPLAAAAAAAAALLERVLPGHVAAARAAYARGSARGRLLVSEMGEAVFTAIAMTLCATGASSEGCAMMLPSALAHATLPEAPVRANNGSGVARAAAFAHLLEPGAPAARVGFCFLQHQAVLLQMAAGAAELRGRAWWLRRSEGAGKEVVARGHRAAGAEGGSEKVD